MPSPNGISPIIVDVLFCKKTLKVLSGWKIFCNFALEINKLIVTIKNFSTVIL